LFNLADKEKKLEYIQTIPAFLKLILKYDKILEIFKQ